MRAAGSAVGSSAGVTGFRGVVSRVLRGLAVSPWVGGSGASFSGRLERSVVLPARAEDALRFSEGSRRSVTVGAVSLAALIAVLSFSTPASAQTCPNAAIRAAQGTAVEALPDCMAIEMVSPPEKDGNNAYSPSLTSDGERVRFTSPAALAGTPTVIRIPRGDWYVASRGGDRWQTQFTAPPPHIVRVWKLETATSFTPDFASWFQLGATFAQYQVANATVYRGALGGVHDALSPLLTPLEPAGTASIDAEFQAASSDHARVYFRSGGGLAGPRYVSGQPVATGPGAVPSTYVAGLDTDGDPTLSLLARGRSSQTGTIRDFGGSCGATLGGDGHVASGTAAGGSVPRNQGAVSADGSRVFFSTRPSQPAIGACDPVNKLRILDRRESAQGPSISHLIPNGGLGECDRTAPVCSIADGNDLFQGASVDGQRVYFTSSRQLADSDVDDGAADCQLTTAVAGCDLYLFDADRPAGARLIQVSTGDASAPTPGAGANVYGGVTAISGDGSHVYYVAQGVLTTTPNSAGDDPIEGQPNLYVYQRDDDYPNGRTLFIATLDDGAGSDVTNLWGGINTYRNLAYPVPVSGRNEAGVEVGGAGSSLFFQTTAPVTEDDADASRDIFRYETATGELARISKGEPGGADNGEIDVASRISQDDYPLGTDFAQENRWISDDGRTVVFQTGEGLLAADSNGVTDSYLWRDGELTRLPGTDQSAGGDHFTRPAVSQDGTSIAFTSNRQLLPQDGDWVRDIYVARVGGGLARPPLDDDPCDLQAGGCQGAGAAPIAPAPIGTDKPSSEAKVVSARARLAMSGVSRRARVRASRTGVLRLRVRSNRAGVLRFLARGRVGKRAARVGRGTARLRKAGAVTVELRLNRRARRALRRGEALALTVRVTQQGARARSMSVRLPGVKR